MKKGWREDVEEGRVKSGVETVRKVVFGWEGGGGRGGQVGGGWWEVAGEGSEYSHIHFFHQKTGKVSGRIYELTKLLLSDVLRCLQNLLRSSFPFIRLPSNLVSSSSLRCS